VVYKEVTLGKPTRRVTWEYGVECIHEPALDMSILKALLCQLRCRVCDEKVKEGTTDGGGLCGKALNVLRHVVGTLLENICNVDLS
jgi:hypothetical protein